MGRQTCAIVHTTQSVTVGRADTLDFMPENDAAETYSYLGPAGTFTEVALGQVPAAAGKTWHPVNNVGEAYQATFEEVTDEQWDAMWQLNVMSYVRCIRAVLPAMREAGRGTIVNVSSTAGKRPSTGMPNYSVTKAAVLSLSRLIADRAADASAPGRHKARLKASSPPSGRALERSVECCW